MVERPIKKADRQPKPEENDSTSAKRSDDAEGKRSPRNGDKNSQGRKDKRDKRGSRDEEPKAPVNLALVRGPKPTKPQPIVEEVAPEVEAVVESEAETTEE